MFVLDMEPSFSAVVEVPKPGGAVQVIRVTYHYLEPEQYKATVDELRDAPLAALLGRLVKGWDEQDGKGQDGRGWVGMPLPYSEAALDTVAAKQPRFLRSVLNGYLREVTGIGMGN